MFPAPALAALGLGLVLSTSPALSASITAPADAPADAGSPEQAEPASPGQTSPSMGEQATDLTDRAKQAFDEGLSAVAAGQFERAIEAFEEAYRLRPHPVALFNLALALERAERRAEAWALFEVTLDIVQSKRERDEIRHHLDDLAAHVAVLEIKASPRERLCFDDFALPERETGDYRIAIDAGAHVLLFDEHHIDVELAAGEHRLMLLDARAFAETPAPSRLGPAMSSVAIGTGLGALGLGVGAALVAEPAPLRVGLAAGAAASAGVAVTASIIALVAQTKHKRSARAQRRERALTCAGAPALERRLDLALLPLVDTPEAFPAAELSTPQLRPTLPPQPEAAPSLLATRPQKRPLTTTP